MVFQHCCYGHNLDPGHTAGSPTPYSQRFVPCFFIARTLDETHLPSSTRVEARLISYLSVSYYTNTLVLVYAKEALSPAGVLHIFASQVQNITTLVFEREGQLFYWWQLCTVQGKRGLTLLGLQSRFGDKILIIRVFCPHLWECGAKGVKQTTGATGLHLKI